MLRLRLVCFILALLGHAAVVQAQTINTVAGGGPDGVLATTANLNLPDAVAVSGGNYFIAAAGQHRVFKVDPSGTLTVVAGTGLPGFSGDGGSARSASLNTPTGVAVDSSFNLYIADQNNHRIRKVDAVTGFITTVAGTGVAGFLGDGGLATSARLNTPSAWKWTVPSTSTSRTATITASARWPPGRGSSRRWRAPASPASTATP